MNHYLQLSHHVETRITRKNAFNIINLTSVIDKTNVNKRMVATTYPLARGRGEKQKGASSKEKMRGSRHQRLFKENVRKNQQGVYEL